VHSDTCRLRLPILQRASLRKGRTGSERIRAPSGRTDSECTFSRTQASATNIRPSSYSGVAGFESSAPERPMRPAGFRAASGRQWTLATGAESQPSSVCVRSRIFCDFRPRSRMSINQYVSGPIVQKRTIPQIFSPKIPCNLLINLDSGERIQGNPSFSNPRFGGFQSERSREPRNPKPGHDAACLEFVLTTAARGRPPGGCNRAPSRARAPVSAPA
jgi:hypothetical protein